MTLTKHSHAPEPWLRGTRSDVPAIPRAVLHALDLAQEDLSHWIAPITDEQLNARPFGIAPVAFHLRHIACSLDRLLTYAEGRQLAPDQILQMKSELEPGATRQQLMQEVTEALEKSAARILALANADFSQPRAVGGKQLPTTLGGLLVHVADHTQRHVGQAITTSKFVAAPKNS
jgi:uncharacterized damage-inducible protein DinB